jgi:DNA-binding MarR family transcriptional regulator
MSKNKISPHAANEPMPVDHQLTKLFWVIGPAFTRWAESHMHEKGLTPQRVRLMWPLMDGPKMMSALRDELGVSATNITALVDALEKDKMVTRKPHATDRRATMIAITPKAEKLMTENCGQFREKVAGIFSDFTKAQQEKLRELLLMVREALIERHVLEDCELCGASAAAKPVVTNKSKKRKGS